MLSGPWAQVCRAAKIYDWAFLSTAAGGKIHVNVFSQSEICVLCAEGLESSNTERRSYQS